MSFWCSRHSVYVFDRGGQRLIGELTPLSLVRWERTRDDISTATIHVPVRSPECDRVLGILHAGRHEIAIYRGDQRVWEGPITHLTFQGNRVEIQARDVMHYVYRLVMKSAYNNAFPNVTTIIQRARTILLAEMSRREAEDPPVNVLPYLTVHETPEDARTAAVTLPFASSVFDHIDGLAARAGLDYTVVGRAIHLFDVDTPLGQTPTVTEADFLGDVIITEYGLELATYVAITDGEGHAGEAGGDDPYYGHVEVLHAAYDETTRQEDEPLPSVAEMTSQAKRVLAGARPTPVVVRIPDGSTLNPKGVLSPVDMVPGVRVPLMAQLPGRQLIQMQKLDHMRVEETGGSGVAEGIGESVMVTLSPEPHVEAVEE